LDALANSRFDIPGEPGFPLNAVYAKPSNPREADDLRAFVKQLRLETGTRVCGRVYENSDKPSKVFYLLLIIKFSS
jgi:actin related protein 2/3 complex subunit 3